MIKLYSFCGGYDALKGANTVLFAKSLSVEVARKNHDMCMLLGVTKRTLQRYRQLKKVIYYQIDGKTYYKSSEIQEFLKKHNNK